MAVSVLDQARSVFGKAYLVTGVLPASSLLLAWEWYRLGWNGAFSLFYDATRGSARLTAGGAMLVLGIGALGLVLGVSRNTLLWILRQLPGRYCSWLRRLKTESKSREWTELQQQRELVLEQLAAVQWHKHGWQAPGYTPAFLGTPDEAQTLKTSARVRQWISGKEPAADDLRDGRVDSLIHALEQLHLLSASKFREERVKQEIETWKEEATAARCQEILALAAEEVRRRHREIDAALQRYPNRREWIQPTELGNRFEALGDYSGTRYGIDTGLLWPRVLLLSSKEDRREIGDARISLEALTNLSFGFGALVVISLMAMVADLIAREHRVLEGSGFVAAFFLISILAYRGAIHQLDALSETMASIIDANRARVIASVGLTLPATAKEEFEAFEGIQDLLSGTSRLPENTKLAYLNLSPRKDSTPKG